MFTALHTYFMSPTGSDSNDGLTPVKAWATPNHSVVCGDVIVAAAGTYRAFNTRIGTPRNCPSTSGGIDGTGGIWAAVVLCGGSSVGDCFINDSTIGTIGFDIAPKSSDTGNWAFEGWQVSTSSSSSSTSQAFFADARNETKFTVHHVMVINDIVAGNSVGIDAGSNEPASNPGKSWDYLAVVGSIIQNSNIHGICLGAVNLNGPSNYDGNAGTHIYVLGNFIWSNNTSNTACPGGTDEEGIILDTWDLHAYAQQAVIANNIIFTSTGYGLNVMYSGNFASAPVIKIYQNTTYDNSVKYPTAKANAVGEAILQNGPWAITYQNNISKTAQATSNGGKTYAFIIAGGRTTATTVGGLGNQNIFDGVSGQDTAAFDGSTISGPNIIGVDPAFTNVSDLITNRNGVPNCNGFATVTQCMGWNAITGTLTTPSTISDLGANCSQCTGKGYQLPSATCAPNSDYPAYLKGLVVLSWDGSQITEQPGLVNKPCNM